MLLNKARLWSCQYDMMKAKRGRPHDLLPRCCVRGSHSAAHFYSLQAESLEASSSTVQAYAGDPVHVHPPLLNRGDLANRIINFTYGIGKFFNQ